MQQTKKPKRTLPMLSIESQRGSMEFKKNHFFVGFDSGVQKIAERTLMFSEKVESYISNILQNIQKQAYYFQG